MSHKHILLIAASRLCNFKTPLTRFRQVQAVLEVQCFIREIKRKMYGQGKVNVKKCQGGRLEGNLIPF